MNRPKNSVGSGFKTRLAAVVSLTGIVIEPGCGSQSNRPGRFGVAARARNRGEFDLQEASGLDGLGMTQGRQELAPVGFRCAWRVGEDQAIAEISPEPGS